MVFSHKCFDRRALLTSGWTMRTNRVRSYLRRHDECLRVMYFERRKGSARTLNHRLCAFHEVQHVHPALGVVRYRPRKPVPPRLDEFEFMQPRALLSPIRSGGHLLELIDE